MSNETNILLTTDLLQLITAEQAWHYSIVPKSLQNGILELYIKESSPNSIHDEIEVVLGRSVVLIPKPDNIINQTIGKYYRRSENKGGLKQRINTGKTDDFLQNLIHEANSINCSDIHIESYEEACRVRLRIDGKLVERYVINKAEYPAIINKVKIQANLDIAEKRLPQDGRIFINKHGVKFDIRVSVLPTLYGEKIVLRLLSKDSTNIDLTELGFSEKQLADYLEGIKKTHGIVLISGPTGSGKTTTLYGTLKILNQEHTNILTIEDPIEYTLDGINQVQLNEGIGLSFTSALRTFLRQDPDVIMLGEIRDGETAQMAIRAALTGHLVFSTIHTNSAWGTISRLIDMGVPPFLLANTLNLSLAQRLIRKLCPHCKKEQPFSMKSLPANYDAPRTILTQFVAQGCDSCYFTGYKGRKAVYEVIPVDSHLSKEIKQNNYEIADYLKEKNINRLSESAFEYFAKGDTTLEEIYPILINDL